MTLVQTLCPFFCSIASLAGSCAHRLLLLLRPRGSRNICKTALGPAYVRWVSWCAVCAVRYGTRVSCSRRGVPRYRGACAPSPPGITEVPPPRVHPARARSFVQELNFGPIADQFKEMIEKSLPDASLHRANQFSPVAKRTFHPFGDRKSLLLGKQIHT